MKKSNKSIVVIGVFLVAILLSIRLINNKREEVYELDSSNNLKEVEGKRVAILYKDSDNEEYKDTDNVPVGNYEVTEDSYCTKGESKEHIQTTMEYRDNKVYIKADSSGLKCFVYLKKIKEPTAEDTLAKLSGLVVSDDSSKCPIFDENGYASIKTRSIEPNTLLCRGVDDDGETYYFRGQAPNNWVLIDNIYWRIIRINGNGSIRLIYNGNTTNKVGKDTMLFYDSGSGNNENVAYNLNYDDNAYVGYMYGIPGQIKITDDDAAYKATHANLTNSDILEKINYWYTNSKFLSEIVRKYLDGNTGFCGDRTPYAESTGGIPDRVNKGYGNVESNGTTYYEGNIRVMHSKKATFKCPQKEQDLYTIFGSKRGNEKLPIPVGLITADEIMFAGGIYGTDNYAYYLYNAYNYWAMTPNCYNGHAYVSYISDEGWLEHGYVNDTRGVRPVINLKANVTFEEGGDGTSSKPFTVKLD